METAIHAAAPARTRASTALLCACVVPALLCACARSTPSVAPQTGRITVGVSTRGPVSEYETLAFTVEIQPPGTRERIGANAGVYDEDLPPGEYVVRLRGLPAQCRVNGVSQRRVTVSARRTTAVRFSVTCDR